MIRNVLVPMLTACSFLVQVAPSPAQPTDEQQIKAIEQIWDDAWNRHDAKAMASVLADDADFITVGGMKLRGREAFQAHQEKVQGAQFAASTRRTIETNVRFLTPDMGIVHSRAAITGDKNLDGSARKPREVLMTRVVRKLDGRWVVVAAHNTNILVGVP
jgi:uncharacterized protein (TIGR02246 family)